jgi:hypothetical protein
MKHGNSCDNLPVAYAPVPFYFLIYRGIFCHGFAEQSGAVALSVSQAAVTHFKNPFYKHA